MAKNKDLDRLAAEELMRMVRSKDPKTPIASVIEEFSRKYELRLPETTKAMLLEVLCRGRN